MTKKKNIMILGGGIFQVTAIKSAVELGYHVITVDYLPKNIGHRYSHEYINLSTTDSKSILKAARENEIDGIFSMASDLALPTLAQVSQTLGLVGPSIQAVNILTKKNYFRHFQKQIGLDTPQSQEVEALALTNGNWANVPFMVKPAVSSGSRGVAVTKPPHAEFAGLVENACNHSFNGKACVEEYIDGRDICVDGFVTNNSIQKAFFSDKQMEVFSVLGHKAPCDLPENLKIELLRQVQLVFNKIAYESGPFDADFRVSGDRPVLLEITPRLGGNGVPLLAGLAFDTDLVSKSIQHSMGESPDFSSSTSDNACTPAASVLLFSDRTGIVQSFNHSEKIKRRVHQVVDVCIALEKGQKVEKFEHGGHVFGYCLLKNRNGISFKEMSRQILDALDLNIS